VNKTIKRWLIVVTLLVALLFVTVTVAVQNHVDLNAPVIIASIGLISVAIGALVGPLVKEPLVSSWEKEKLRNGLYRELARWYELAVWYRRDYDRKSENRFFTPSTFEVRPEATKIKKEPTVGESVLQAEGTSHIRRQIGRIGRDSLQWKLAKLEETLARISVELTADNLYSKTLQDESQLQLFYQLKECAQISEFYEDFRYALEYKLTSYESVPSSRFLSPAEAKKLSELEARLDWLKITYLAVAQAEDSGEFDSNLLNKMRMGKRRGTMIHYTGEASEAARWCLHCKRYSEPERRIFLKERCRHCENALPTIDEFTKQLSASHGELRVEAATALAKTYKYNFSELTLGNIRGLISALRDPLPQVRECAATALKRIGKGLQKVQAADGVVDLRDEAVAVLVTKLSSFEKELRVKKAAIRAIGQIYRGSYNAGKARKPLAQALNDFPQIVGAAVWAIGVIGDERLFYSIQALLARPNFYAQEYAAAALEALGCFGHFGKDSVQLCVSVLTDKNKKVDVRSTAAFILGNIGDISEVWEPLTQVAHDLDADADLRVQAKHALASISSQYDAA
jgi:HEAT repeat protein